MSISELVEKNEAAFEATLNEKDFQWPSSPLPALKMKNNEIAEPFKALLQEIYSFNKAANEYQFLISKLIYTDELFKNLKEILHRLKLDYEQIPEWASEEQSIFLRLIKVDQRVLVEISVLILPMFS